MAMVVFGITVGATSTVKEAMKSMMMAATLVMVSKEVVVTVGSGWPPISENMRPSSRTWDMFGSGGCAVRVARTSNTLVAIAAGRHIPCWL